MFKKLLLVVAVMFSSSVHAADPFTTDQLVGTGIMLTTLYVDYRQTLDIKNHQGMYETNPMLGKHPSDTRVRNYFIASAVTTAAITYFLPTEYRWYFIGGVTALEIGVIGHNKHIGLRTNF